MTEAQTETVTPEIRVWRAFGRMPYMPMTGYVGTSVMSLDEIADALEALADVLAGVGRRANENEEELRYLKADMAAVRRVLGVDAPVAS